MRTFAFRGKTFDWLTFKNEKAPGVIYGRHSFFTTNKDLLLERSNFVLPEGYGLKVFKDHKWHDTNMVETCIIQNIFWINGLAPRIKEILRFEARTKKDYMAYLVEPLSGDKHLNIEELEKVAKENFIEIYYGGSDLELNNTGNWLGGKYLDFGGFKIDKEAYKTSLIERINEVTHYGHLMGDKPNSYQSIDDWGVMGKRKMNYRIDRMGLNKINFQNKSVIDIGCNLGLMLHYADSHGASSLIGYDLPKVIKVAREYANFREKFDFDFFEGNLKETPPKEKADIVFFLAMSEYLGFPEWLRDITKETCIYEGHGIDSASETEIQLKKLFPTVVYLGVSEDRNIRPLFICYK